MNSYPLHPAVLAATRAAQAHTSELQARAAASAKRDATAAKFRTTTAGMQPPAAGTNPWLDASWNMSQQSYILNKAPETAARLRAEAGLDGIFTPSREDARRAQQSGGFIARSVAAAVTSEKAETPAPVPQAAPVRDSTTASPEALSMVREALVKIGATVSPVQFLSIAESLDGRTRTDSTGRVEVLGSDGQPLIDWRATSEAKRIVSYTVDKFLNVVHGIEQDPPKPAAETPAEPETPAPAAEFVPLHVRVQRAVEAGPEAVQALMAEGFSAAPHR